MDAIGDHDGKERGVSAGWVLVQTADDAAPDVAAELGRLDGVLLVERTEGAYDVVARVADTDGRERSVKRVVQAVLRVPGVTLAVCCHDNDGAEAPAVDLTAPRDSYDAAWVRSVRAG